jgi:hypothetical protein
MNGYDASGDGSTKASIHPAQVRTEFLSATRRALNEEGPRVPAFSRVGSKPGMVMLSASGRQHL